MHRSGTSAFARILNLLGAALPKHIMEPTSSNEKGHWEPEKLVNLHDELLSEVGTRWDDLNQLPLLESGRLAHYKSEITRLLEEEYGDSPMFVVKDPRMCRLMPIWRDVLKQLRIEARFVLPFRNPLEVAQSLRKRNGLPVGHGCLLWLRDVLESEYETRHARRVFVHYQKLLNAPLETAKDVGMKIIDNFSDTNGEIDQALSSFVEFQDRHNIAKFDDLRYPLVAYQWLREVYACCARLVDDPLDGTIQRRLDAVRDAFRSVTVPLTVLLAAHQSILEESSFAALPAGRPEGR